MLRLSSLGCRREGEVLFADATEFFTRGQKIGVTGRNGCGKSSLFAQVLGQLDIDEGEVTLQPGSLLAHVAQETPSSDKSALEYVIDGDQRLRALQQKIALHENSADNSVGDSDANQYAELLEQLEAMGGYSAEARAGSLLNGLGFEGTQHGQAVNSFSGGWRMRLNLASALMCPSDILLLDEPTNHLDLDAVFWLESWLKRYEGTLLLISHDREFLDSIADSILHIEHQKVTRYTGNYTSFESYRAEQLARQQALFERQQRKISEIESFVDRFRAKATKARQAQSRIKMLERMSRVAPAHVDTGFSFSFEKPGKVSDPLVTLEKAKLGYGSDCILSGVTLQLRAGDRIALLGVNGAGKSTLVKSLVGELPLLGGNRAAGANLAAGYFAQHQIDQLDYHGRALDQLMALDPALSDAAARKFLGGYGFTGDAALQAVATMSGGEKARLVLALMVYQRPNLLLLDEPTNHLDMDMRLALSVALQSFEGALVVVSHDRFLLEAVADQLWLVADGQVDEYKDDLNGYRKWLTIRKRAGESPKPAYEETTAQSDVSSSGGNESSAGTPPAAPLDAAARKQQKREAAQRRQQLAPLKKAMDSAERKHAELQQQLDSLQQKLGDNDLYTGERQSELTELLKSRKELEDKLQAAEDDWLEACQKFEDAQE